MAESVTVIIPVHDEAAALADVVADVKRALRGRRSEVIVVDDGSADGGCDGLAGVRLLRHPVRRGYGAALKTGLREAQGRLVAIIDGDGSYDAAALPRLLAALDGTDMAVGCRTASGRGVPLLRRPAKWLLTRLANYLSAQRIPDLNSGMRAFRREEARRFFSILPAGFSFTTTITLAYLCNDLRVEFIPIDYRPRRGRSKIRPLQDTANFLLLLARTAMLFNPLRVFLPAAFFLLFAGVLEVWYYYYYLNVLNVTTSAQLLLLSSILAVMLGLLADLIVRKQ